MSATSNQEEVPVEPTEAKRDVGSSQRYLTFELADQFYGIELARVQEIVRSQSLTPVPDVPDYVRGVINLRGTVVPVVDVRRRMMMEPRDQDERTCVIVCSFRDEGVGLVVDTVCDVVSVVESEIVESGQGRGDGSANEQMLRGLVRQEDGVKILIDLDEMLSADGRAESTSAA